MADDSEAPVTAEARAEETELPAREPRCCAPG